jgi:2-polyprenyl-6-methoxyphenol hydroxylase-like FAD-dependent oxidoreductase
MHDLFTRQIPKERIHYGAKVVATEANDDGVLLRFVDGSEVKGDILVGADGAYSAVRKGLYAKLKDEGKLPSSDDVPLPFTTVCVLAQTRPLAPEEFPDITQAESQFRNFIATDKMYSVG